MKSTILALKSHLHKRRKQEHLAEGTGVESAKYPSKVKLEIYTNSLNFINILK